MYFFIFVNQPAFFTLDRKKFFRRCVLKVGIKAILLSLAAAAVIVRPGLSFSSGLKGTDTTIKQNSTSFTQVVAFDGDSDDDNSGIVTQDQPQVQQQDQQDENNQPQVDEQQNGGDDQQGVTDQNNGDDQSGSEDNGNSSDDSDENQ
jgi:hypothetical protein